MKTFREFAKAIATATPEELQQLISEAHEITAHFDAIDNGSEAKIKKLLALQKKAIHEARDYGMSNKNIGYIIPESNDKWLLSNGVYILVIKRINGGTKQTREKLDAVIREDAEFVKRCWQIANRAHGEKDYKISVTAEDIADRAYITIATGELNSYDEETKACYDAQVIVKLMTATGAERFTLETSGYTRLARITFDNGAIALIAPFNYGANKCHNCIHFTANGSKITA